MLATYPQYTQPLITTPFGATLFAPPGLHTGNSFLGHEPGFAAVVPPSPAFVPFAALAQSYVSPQAPYAAAAQQLVFGLALLAQQISMQSVASQQICSALQQLTQQIQAHSLPALPGLGIGNPYASPFASPYAQIGSPFAGVTSPFVTTPFMGTPSPAWQTWGGQRTPTIQ